MATYQMTGVLRLQHALYGEWAAQMVGMRFVEGNAPELTVELSARCPLPFQDAAEGLQARLADAEARATLAENALQDLTQEQLYQSGLSEAVRVFRGMIDSESARWGRMSTEARLKAGPVRGLEALTELLAGWVSGTAVRGPLLPEQLRAENERMRLALTEVAGLCADGEYASPAALLAAANRGLGGVPF